MSATRRKGSRSGRAASRAGGPPASNALTWAESLAAGEAAPGPTALEWAEALAENEKKPSSPWGAAGTAAPPGPALIPAPALAPAEESGESPWGSVPAPDADGGDANPWGSVAAAEPVVSRGRGRNAGGKSGKTVRTRSSKGKGARSGTKGAPKSELPVTPAGGFPLNAAAVADDLPPAAPAEDLPPAPTTEPDELAEPVEKKAARAPVRRISRPTTAQQKKIRSTLRRGLPKVLDKPVVLVLAGVTAAVLGLGAGWAVSAVGTDGDLPTADPASCAQTQMAWTRAANAQSAMVEEEPETLRKGFINARNALEGVTPPEAIAADWAVAFTYYSTVANNIEKVKPDDGPAVISAVGGAQQELDTEAMVEAFETISSYVNSNCEQ